MGFPQVMGSLRGGIWVFLGARGSGDGAGSVGRRASSEGLAAHRQYGEHWSLQTPLGGWLCSLSNKCVTPNPKYTTKSESDCHSVSFLMPSSWGLRW